MTKTPPLEPQTGSHGGLTGRTVVLAVTGSIAAYKSVEVARLCILAGARVLPVMTRSATQFVGPMTLRGICGEPVALDMWDPAFPGEVHVDLSRRADAIVIVPATADALARLAHGRADDLVTAIALCARGPVLAVPAMHPRMWDHPATRENVERIRAHGRIQLVGPVDGAVASGESGMGRMSNPDAVVTAIRGVLTPRDLDGVRVLVTAGPTVEDIDPVRFLGNRSSGKMGFALAEAAASRGATVTLVAGPVALATPRGVNRIDVRSALAMKQAVWDTVRDDMTGVDAVIMAAAVADYRPAHTHATKQKKQGEQVALDLVRNADIIAEVGSRRRGPSPTLIAFAVESGDDSALIAYARAKLHQKKVDWVITNNAALAFAGDNNQAIAVGPSSEQPYPTLTKRALADQILNLVRRSDSK